MYKIIYISIRKYILCIENGIGARLGALLTKYGYKLKIYLEYRKSFL